MNYTDVDYEKYMRACVELAERGYGSGIKLPHVGAVIVNDDKIVAEGYRKFVDGTRFTVHAERDALDNAEGLITQESLLVTTLEPCAARAKDRREVFTPCAEMIVERGIRNVVFGFYDNSKNMRSGLGVQYLKHHGIYVVQYKKLNYEIAEHLMCQYSRDEYFNVPQRRANK